ncbi:hypothetical protein [Halomonas heilongjiangensis]|uniref:Uncharacterized protein n=1 Tax=Halomonas heilongjiangensis TaxID=1387883 RepID=A0A2N7TU52_9GAMM|nr:hypothetical protein [Halomonas heilongjiangensis]PMR71701.1 hypothetical protein C1H66_01300 [Halomonas heilongjiangensis]PXX89422.1 hypothetical protein CR158_10750 [Halomonas heilongjiangensis]
MAQLISLLDARIISFFTRDDDLYPDEFRMSLSEGPEDLYEAMRENDHAHLSCYTKAQFIASFNRVCLANWPHLTSPAFQYAIGEDRIMLPHEVTEEQRVRMAGSWIVQEQDAVELTAKDGALRRGEPIQNLLEMSVETAVNLSGADASNMRSVPSVQEASEKLAVNPSAVEAFLEEPHHALRMCSKYLKSMLGLSLEPSSRAMIIPFPGRCSEA